MADYGMDESSKQEEARLNKQVDKRINRRASPVRSMRGVPDSPGRQGIVPQQAKTNWAGGDAGAGIKTAAGKQSEQMRNRNYAPMPNMKNKQNVAQKPVAQKKITPEGRKNAIGRALGRM